MTRLNSLTDWFAGLVAIVGLVRLAHSLGGVPAVNLSAQLVSILAIAIAIFSGSGNIFSAPEFAFGSDGRTWAHLLAHMFIDVPVGTLVGWAIGSLVLWGRNYARNPRVSHV